VRGVPEEIAQAREAAAYAAPRHERDSAYAWRMVAAGFLATFTLFGVAYSFGAFFRPMAHEFGASREAISAIFSITSCIYFLLGPITGHLADRFGPRPVAATGAIAMGAGLVATAYTRHLWAAYFTYGLGVGIAVACCYVPMTAMIGGWFLRRRNSALGIVASGIGVGTLAIAPLAAELIKHFGWRDAYAILGVAAGACLLVCAWIAERPPVQLGAVPFRLRHAMRTPNFLILYASGMLATVATAVPFVFLAPYAESIGIGEVSAATLVGIIGLAGTAGRLGLGALADRFGVISLYRGCVLALGLSYGIWLGAHSWMMLALFAIAMGASYGGAVALTPAVIAELFGTQGLGVMLGALYTNGAIGTLLGPPICGAIIDRTGSYLIAIGFTLLATIAAFVVLLWLAHPRVPGHTADGATAS
jgi:MFS family permease